MKIRVSITGFILFTLLMLTPVNVFGQQQYFVLREIVHNKWDSRRRTPDRVEVNSRGGFIEFSVNYYGNCTEKYRFEFTFDQDMSVLNAGEQYGFTTRTKVLSNVCNNNRDPYFRAGAANGTFSALIGGTNFRPLVNGMGMASGWDRLYAKGNLKGAKTGSLHGAFLPAKNNKLDAYSWLHFYIEANSNLNRENSFGYEILFVYQIVEEFETPSGDFTCPPPDCSGFPGTVPVWNFQTQTGECWCPEGTVWNKQLNKCVSVSK